MRYQNEDFTVTQIGQNAGNAFMQAKKFSMDNTEVEVLPNVTVLKLYGHEIAYQYNDPDRTLSVSAAGHLTQTTKDRLNAITGVNVKQIKRKWYLNDKLWNGELIDVK